MVLLAKVLSIAFTVAFSFLNLKVKSYTVLLYVQEEGKITAATSMNHKCLNDCTELRSIYNMWEAVVSRNTFTRKVMLK